MSEFAARYWIVPVLLQATLAAAANGVVGTGTPASCTESAFNTAFSTVQTTGGGTITFNCGSAPQIIVFTGIKNVSQATTIQGAGLVTLSGGNATSLFQVFAAGSLTLNDIVLTRGFGTSGAVQNFGKLTIARSTFDTNTSSTTGGAIQNFGDLTIDGSLFTGNSAKTGGGAIDGQAGSITIGTTVFAGNRTTDTTGQTRGGAIRSAASLKLTDVTLRLNVADFGGALFIAGGAADLTRVNISFNGGAFGAGVRQEGGTLTARELSMISNGAASFADSPGPASRGVGGGGLSFGSGTATITNATIAGNSATSGGGVYQQTGTTGAANPVTTFTNTTFFANNATDGGAIYQRSGTMTIVNATISDNSASSRGNGIANIGGTLSVKNTAIAMTPPQDPSTAPTPVANCSNPISATTSSFNMSTDTTCGFGTGRDNVEIALDMFANNGGFAITLMPSAGSRLIDNGTGLGCPATDQRGVSRPAGAACDVGAVEYVPGAPKVAAAYEYYHAGFGHYFVTYDFNETFRLDLGSFEGWARTGLQFNVFPLEVAQVSGVNADDAKAVTAPTPVCRFFTTAFPPTSSHFYAPRGLGCEGTMTNKDWDYEGDVFAAYLPDGTGACPAGNVPVYRLYNNGKGGAPNHRYTTSTTIRQQMIAAGYIAEGAGIGVGWCSPQ